MMKIKSILIVTITLFVFSCTPADDGGVENAPVEDTESTEGGTEEGVEVPNTEIRSGDPDKPLENPELVGAQQAVQECEAAYLRMERELMVKDSIIASLQGN